MSLSPLVPPLQFFTASSRDPVGSLFHNLGGVSRVVDRIGSAGPLVTAAGANLATACSRRSHSTFRPGDSLI